LRVASCCECGDETGSCAAELVMKTYIPHKKFHVQTEAVYSSDTLESVSCVAQSV
jgi:hypothetical protein